MRDRGYTVLRHLIILSTIAQATSAQRPSWLHEPYLRPAVYGVIRDSASGRPVPHARITVDGAQGIAFSDSAGQYIWFDLPRGVHSLSYHCPTERVRLGRVALRDTLSIGEATDSIVNVRISLEQCSEPPVRDSVGEFRGFYSSGFETSTLDLCPTTAPDEYRGTAYEGVTQHASMWIAFTPGGADGVKWPKPANYSYSRLYVRFHGTRTGPGSYGHLGGAGYRLLVDSTLEVRTVPPADCR